MNLPFPSILRYKAKQHCAAIIKWALLGSLMTQLVCAPLSTPVYADDPTDALTVEELLFDDETADDADTDLSDDESAFRGEDVASEEEQLQSSGSIRLEIDGFRVDLGPSPLLIDGRLLVPLRVVSEYLGAIVHWEAEENKPARIILSFADQVVELYVNDRMAFIDNAPRRMDVPPCLEDGLTYVPLRFLGEALGIDVFWDSGRNTVYLTSPIVEPEPEPEPISLPSSHVDELIETGENLGSQGSREPVSGSQSLPSTPSSTTSLPANTSEKNGYVTIGSASKLASGVVIDITSTEPFTFKTMQLSNPERYVIDLFNTQLVQADGELAIDAAGIAALRYAHHDGPPPYTRLVLDVESRGRTPNIIQSDDGKTLTISSDFYYISAMQSLRYARGEELILSFDGIITPKVEPIYVGTTRDPVSLPSSLVIPESELSRTSLVASVASTTTASSSVAASSPSSSVSRSVASTSSSVSSSSSASSAVGSEGSTSVQVSRPAEIVYKTAYRSIYTDPLLPPENAENAHIVAIATDDLNVRSGPGTQFDPPLTVLTVRSEATLLDDTGEWALLRLQDGTVGWSATEYLDFVLRAPESQRPSASGSGASANSSRNSGTAQSSVASVSSAASSSSASASSAVVTSSGASRPVSSTEWPSNLPELPSSMRDVVTSEQGYGDAFRIFLPGIYPELPGDYSLDSLSLLKTIEMSPARDGSWLDITLKAKMPYQINVNEEQIELSFNLSTQVDDVRLSSDASSSIVTVDMSRTVGYVVDYFSNPDRITITVPGAGFGDVPLVMRINDGLISQITSTSSSEGAVITIQLEYLIGYRVVSERRSNTIQVRFYTRGLEGKTIYLDPGHGGDPRYGGDPGAISRTTPTYFESTSTLDIGLKLRSLLEAAGATVLMSRTSDENVPYQRRPGMANNTNADIFVSIHHNSSTNPAAHGIETYYWAQTADRLRLATLVQNSLINSLRLEDRKVKREEFNVIKYTTMPGILVEIGFISNVVEERLIRDEMWRQRAANALFEGISAFFE